MLRTTNEPWSHVKNQVSLTYFTGQNRPPRKVAANGHFQASWSSHTACCSQNVWRCRSCHRIIGRRIWRSSVANNSIIVVTLSHNALLSHFLISITMHTTDAAIAAAAAAAAVFHVNLVFEHITFLSARGTYRTFSNTTNRLQAIKHTA